MLSDKNRVLECPVCETKTLCEVVGESGYLHDWMNEPETLVLLKCNECRQALAARYESIQIGANEYQDGVMTRVWPDPEYSAPATFPQTMKSSLEEARRCFSVKAYNAAVVMCGRAMEALCKDQGVGGAKNLFTGLNDLKANGIIDGRLYEWGQALRVVRNIGAHAQEMEVKREDAKDVVDFTDAIGEYVYTLTQKYKTFQDRQAKDNDKASESHEVATK